MSDILVEYMDKLREYYRKKHNNLNLSTKEVVNIILEKKNNDFQITEKNYIKSNSITDIDIKDNLELDELLNNKNFNNSNWLINPEKLITSHRKIIGKFIVLGKKTVRKFLRWYINPIVEDQSKFNGSVTRCINEIYNKLIVSQYNFKQINRSYSDIDNKFNKMNEKINKKLDDLDKKINNIDDITLKHKYEIENFKNKIEHSIVEYTNRFKENLKHLENVLLEIKHNQEIIENQLNLIIKEKVRSNEENLKYLENALSEIKHDQEVIENELNLNLKEKVRNNEEKIKQNIQNYVELKEVYKEIKESEIPMLINNIKRVSDLLNSTKAEYYNEKEKILKLIDLQSSNIIERFETDFAYLAYKIKNIQSNNNYKKENPIKTKDDKVPNINSFMKGEFDYFLFENRFRGSEKLIKESQNQYVKYFINQDNVLDIGCGRGEFLELLSEQGISAKGIDIYSDFVTYCLDKGLDVEENDAISYLNDIPDSSLGGIFLGQVVEHLDKDYLVNLIELCYKKLRPGSYFVCETPNPTMLSTFSNSFYLDLTHQKPIHPETMKFLLQYFGFKDIEIQYSRSSKVNYELPLLNSNQNIGNLKEFNDGINLLNSLLFGYQDYAIIGKK